MYFGSQEIESIDNNIVTLKNWDTIEIEEKNKQLFTEELTTGSELQHKWSTMIAKEIIDVLHANNVRLTDINYIINIVNDIITGKNEEAVVNAFGKEKLDTITSIFGWDEKLPSLAVRNIRMKDIFN